MPVSGTGVPQYNKDVTRISRFENKKPGCNPNLQIRVGVIPPSGTGVPLYNRDVSRISRFGVGVIPVSGNWSSALQI